MFTYTRYVVKQTNPTFMDPKSSHSWIGYFSRDGDNSIPCGWLEEDDVQYAHLFTTIKRAQRAIDRVVEDFKEKDERMYNYSAVRFEIIPVTISIAK
jgi:hypothetical protein